MHLASATRRDLTVRAAVEQALITEDQPIAALLDVDSVRASAAALRAAFEEVAAPGQPLLHAFAVKAAALVPVLRLLADNGLGAEVASPGELALAQAAGIGPDRTVLDSPAKTPAELRTALDLGVAVNADSQQELARLDALVGAAPLRSAVGLRINPQLGSGSIDAMSTATATSKFGIALRDPGAREWLVRAYADRPWLTRLHAHSGSQGIPLDLMAAGVKDAYELAEEINGAVGRQQIDTLDIGGGLPVNFASESTEPTFHDYAQLLSAQVPGLFDGRYGLVTEFGRSLLAKAGTIVARVEYTKSAGGRPIAVTHAGAQIAARTVFAPDAWPVRIGVYGPQGLPKQGAPIAQDVAGPCCFAGDLVGRERALPGLEAGDLVALLDTGAYYFSNPFGYNSLPRPGVYGYWASGDGTVRFATVRRPQTLDQIVTESGAGQRDALTPPC
ncbi:diaminopimelate decarboxylase [Streptomyces gobiensis]|uniref:diaminopimelate decarboxylase n=1 Tax=Streptomyces gobiensis TaxID=2875706 RepID=UPI001E36FFBC|nr:diaminopimelate decarboxylase [Streptomyces gobiensis]UGY91801.1 diaminopimelate decarboxylase [Streptomyces gobiensis]